MTTTDTPDQHTTLSTVLAGAGGMNLGQILDSIVQYAEESKHDPSDAPRTLEGLLDDLGCWVHASVEIETGEPMPEPEGDLITVRISSNVHVSPAFVAYTRDLVDSPDLSVEECVLTALDSALENTEEMAADEGWRENP